ncbi:hypothetical protein JTB14_014927 [Gonioctena quinquepunctata]|nr:hypothetical protein JTB14_014927 [Gonioctena quinquepunctata]
MSGTRQRPHTPDRGRKSPININSETDFPLLSPEYPEMAANTSQLTEIPTFSGVVTRSRANSNSSIRSNLSVKSQAPTITKSNEKNAENQLKTQDQPTFTKLFNIRNLPDNLKFQAEVNPNRTALVETIDPINIETTRKKIKHIGGCPKIEVIDLRNYKERPSISNKEPTMSFVIRDVDKNLSNEAISKHFRDTGVDFVKLWRIISKGKARANKNVPLVIKYCSRCCKNGHDIAECKENLKCAFCGGDHKSAECTKINEPKCPNCEGNHPAFSMKCPNRKVEPACTKETAPILPTKDRAPLEHMSGSMIDMSELFTLVLLNVLPKLREDILYQLNKITQNMFSWTCISIPGPNFRLHFESY